MNGRRVAQYADPYRASVQNGEDQSCVPRYGRETPAREDASGGGTGEGKFDEQRTTLCLALLQLREARTANHIAVEYNAISADAAWWARLGGLLVTFLGLVSVIGTIIALFAASDARRAMDAGAELIVENRRASRAYLQIVVNPDAPWIVGIRNFGATSAVLSFILTCQPDCDVFGRDPSVMRWEEHVRLDHTLAALSEIVVPLPFVGRSNHFGTLIGLRYRDVYGEEWCSWRHSAIEAATGLPCYGRGGEFPLNQI